MSDTIELLSTIGQDASLRHASAEELAPILEQANASEALKAAVAAGNSSLLSEELGNKPRFEPQIVHSPGHEDEESDQGDADSSQPSEPDNDTLSKR
ncbi:hypothetical protein EAH75_00700 [Rhodanobacter glycinis]|uniref:Uncharacterized protein n=1 Tax=Rhodanobacter glycinis TaxID=582702 RepID=A0A502FKX0_9GAMM|nr:hypothetical protein [Rhodanobacter glycinis]TPG08184.1 hypothetical protein EAH88_11045 [Rhodanobacter glycinis]TPG50061.1 hypothetical protein EAH75_00700 [Rhodanobacter glycinis]